MSRKRKYTGAVRRAAFKGDETILSEIFTKPEINSDDLEDLADDAFISACANGNFELVKNMIPKTPKKKNYSYVCALQTVLWTGNVELYKYLFNVYENEILREIPHMTDKYRLHFLINDTFLYGDYEIVEFMLAKIGHIPSIRQTFFKYSCEDGDLEMVLRLKEIGINNIDEGFIAACSKGRVDIVRYLLHSVDDDTVNDGLTKACNNEHSDVVIEILNKGVMTLEESLENVLIIVNFKSCKIIRIFVERGVDIEIINDEILKHAYKIDKIYRNHVRSLISAVFFCGKIDMLDWSRFSSNMMQLYLNLHILTTDTKRFFNALQELSFKRVCSETIGLHYTFIRERETVQRRAHNILKNFVCDDICKLNDAFVGFFNE